MTYVVVANCGHEKIKKRNMLPLTFPVKTPTCVGTFCMFENDFQHARRGSGLLKDHIDLVVSINSVRKTCKGVKTSKKNLEIISF